MNYQRLIFDGDPHSWIDKIINSSQHLLLTDSNVLAQKSLSSPSEKWNDKRQIGLYTSASTGAAKCIWNTFDRLRLNASITARELEISRNDTLLMLAKPWHIAGISWMLMADQIGAEWRFITTKSGAEERWHQALKELNPDYLLTVPAVLNRLMKWGDWSVANIVFGGDALKNELYQPLKKYGQSLYQIYGQTEAGGMISCKKMDLLREISPQIDECYGRPPEEFNIKCEGIMGTATPILLKSPTSAFKKFYNTTDFGFIGASEQLYLAGRTMNDR